MKRSANAQRIMNAAKATIRVNALREHYAQLDKADNRNEDDSEAEITLSGTQTVPPPPVAVPKATFERKIKKKVQLPAEDDANAMRVFGFSDDDSDG